MGAVLRLCGGVRYSILAGLALAAATLSLPGCGSGSDSDALSLASLTTIEPVMPQRLAFASDSGIGVVEGERVRQVASLPPDPGGVEEIAWSGDGRQLAWIGYSEDFDSTLTMVDVTTGERHVWRGVYPPIRSGTTGVMGNGYDARFQQYLPDGSTEEFAVRVPPPVDPERTEPAPTYVLGAIPSEGAWLVAAENSERLAMPAASYRIFRYDPQHPSLVPRSSIENWLEPTRLDDHRVAWIDARSIDYCRNADRVSGYRERAPALPARPDHRSWRIRRVIADDGEVDVLARGTGPPHEDQPGYEDDCAAGEKHYRWLSLRDGAWIDREGGLVELDVADDGRVARVEGEICRPYEYDDGCYLRGEGEYESLRFGFAHLDFPNGSRVDLPAGTRLLRFSPATAITVRHTIGRGPALDDELVLDDGGFGALRFGATAEQIQAATRSPLSFDLDHAGCGTVRLTDLGADRELGVEGELVDGRLETISATTLDVPADEERPAVSVLQPDVSAIRPRGPRTDRGVRAGNTADRLLNAYGTPAETRVDSAIGDTVYVFTVEGAKLTAVVDGGATVRRLEFGRETEDGSCDE